MLRDLLVQCRRPGRGVGMRSPRRAFSKMSGLKLELDEAVEQAAGIELADIGAGTDQGRRGNRGIDTVEPGGEVDARAGFNQRAEIERVRQIRRAAGAGRGATACACAAKDAGGGS